MRISGKVGIAVAAGLVLITTVWAGGILYWHFRITAAVRDCEREAKVLPAPNTQGAWVPLDALDSLGAAGGRALPYLIGSLHPDQKPAFLVAATAQIVRTLNGEPTNTQENCDLRGKRSMDWIIDLGDTRPECARKCAGLQQWWREHGQEVQPWWRFWSGACPAP